MTSYFTDLLSVIGERGRALVERHSAFNSEYDLVGLSNALLSQKGEASGIALASDFFTLYETLDPPGKAAFFEELADQFGPDLDKLSRAVNAYKKKPSHENAIAIHEVSEPRRQELFRRLNQAPDGTARLVGIREDLIGQHQSGPGLSAPGTKEVDRDFHHLFTSWFNRGFLVLKRITWATPATVLEKIIKYEAVHEIGTWEELRRRIEPPDRRCYAFFHPALTDEPLIFVEVALTDTLPDAIAPVIAANRSVISSRQARFATFYSISNCQKGLAGISFGSFLIKQVAEDLHAELPHIKTFVTLSPVPGFMIWLQMILKIDADDSPLFDEQEQKILDLVNTPDWAKDEKKAASLHEIVLPLVAHYLLYARDSENKPLDPVARFHLGNGARLERINWQADLSLKSLGQSAGIMVNYLYDLGDIEKNHETYTNQNAVVASSLVTRLAKKSSSSLAMEIAQ